MAHRERHRSERIGWLRAAVLGANDGIVSTASLVVGVAAAQAARQDVLVAGVAGLVAGALSMAAGEYVSVSSQADTEQADLKRERHELATEPQAEEDELTSIYVRRGLAPELARTVARQLTAKGALAAHARDELGPDRRTRRAAVAGGFRVGGNIRRRRRSAHSDDSCRTIDRARAGRLRGVVVVPGRTRRHRRPNRRGTDAGRRDARHGMGRIGDGRNGRSRKTIRHDRRIVASRDRWVRGRPSRVGHTGPMVT